MNKRRLVLSCAASLCARALLSPLRLLPVKRTRVLFVSFRGKQYSCNPRAISEELEKAAGGRLEIIWAFHEPEKFKKLKTRGIRVISDRGISFALAALTARVVCTNTYYKPYLPRRKAQFYLRTWHGGGAYKRVDYPHGLAGFYIKLQQQGADLYLSSSRAFTELTLRGSFAYTGEVLECGMPRNDVLVTGAWRAQAERVRAELGLTGRRIALYAPTYREGAQAYAPLQTDKLKAALSERFGGSWAVLYRGHHVDAVGSSRGVSGFDLDVSAYEDMQTLLCAADVLITDYSSSVWDMSLTGKSAFLYCPDIDAYRRERDFYTPIDAWPYPLARDNAELIRNIRAFDPAAYAQAIKAHHAALGICESGHASRDCAERIKAICLGK
ncbi:MAG: CDP-glycerol glycerophosphotransferase family protein [Clostridia bacterium]|nr:CDP-glycerol glycerophosphotransferase family protein [Clostridia bacterium]